MLRFHRTFHLVTYSYMYFNAIISYMSAATNTEISILYYIRVFLPKHVINKVTYCGVFMCVTPL